MTNCGEHHIHQTIWKTYRVSLTTKGKTVSQSFVNLGEAIVFRDALVAQVPPRNKSRDRKAYMREYNQKKQNRPRIRTVKPPGKGVYQAGPATVSICEFSTEKPAGKWVAPEDKRRTKGCWSDKPIIASGPVVVSWT